jgi:hypothetical protein
VTFIVVNFFKKAYKRKTNHKDKPKRSKIKQNQNKKKGAGGDSRHRGGGEAAPVSGRQNSENEKQQTILRPQF